MDGVSVKRYSFLRKVVLGCAPLLAIGLVAGCGSTAGIAANKVASGGKFPAIPPGPIVVGASADLSGPGAASGESEKALVELGLQLFKAQHPHGIDGHQLEIKLEDDAGSASQAVEVAQSFVSQHVAAIFYASDIPELAAAQFAFWRKADIPNFIDGGDNLYTNVQEWPYVFGVDGSNYQYSTAGASFLAARGVKTLGVVSDGTPADNEVVADLQAALEAAGNKTKIVKQVTIPETAVDASSAIVELKAAHPDAVFVAVETSWGPVWNAFNAQNYAPLIVADGGGLYIAHSSLGVLGANAYTTNFGCIPAGTTPPSYVTSAIKEYFADIGTDLQPGALASVQNVVSKIELFYYAVTKYDSVAPQAIKKALETMPATKVWWELEFHFSPTNHFGLTGPLGAQVCKMDPMGPDDIAVSVPD
ncbi:MAG TPA: ABC transporter substrate-binding protein [Acidimicrobiales bacterium]|nr:ABC transporter substrate-binding protein [Acidimicrobiales bacterium]